ncbi:hypothetical protein RB195_006747 [Necator americanus]|uniref:Reverse transcriptase domain-containing protein n=1 Tax=Necator americanus TaxID=51031 RepID=A0ABR1BU17_NECAM
MEKNICYRQQRRKEVVYDDCILEVSLPQGDWHIEEDPNVDYEMLLRGLRACAERVSMLPTTNLDRVSKATKELLERRTLRLDPNASHIERDLREYNILLTAMLSEDEARTSSRREMEIITERPVEDLANRSYSYKGEREDLRNYRPICLLSVLYKVFTEITLMRISRTLDEAQPREQTGFRQGFSCLDHIQTVSRVIELCREYRLPLVLTFVDYEKAFDSVETNAILSALVDQGVDSSYVRTSANCHDRCAIKEELNRRMRAAWAAFAPVREATDELTDQYLRAHLFDSTVLPALCYAAETWAPLPRLGSYLLPTEPLRDAF